MSKKLGVVIAAVLMASAMASAQDQPNRPENRGPRPEAPQGRPRPEPNRPAPKRPAPGPKRPNLGRRPPHHFLSGGRWRRSIHGPAFRYPPGFAYRHWATGAILPSVFLSGAYFYDGYAALGLAPPPAGYRWVRYGPDLLLVNVVTGRVADVVDGAFY